MKNKKTKTIGQKILSLVFILSIIFSQAVTVIADEKITQSVTQISKFFLLLAHIFNLSDVSGIVFL